MKTPWGGGGAIAWPALHPNLAQLGGAQSYRNLLLDLDETVGPAAEAVNSLAICMCNHTILSQVGTTRGYQIRLGHVKLDSPTGFHAMVAAHLDCHMNVLLSLECRCSILSCSLPAWTLDDI